MVKKRLTSTLTYGNFLHMNTKQLALKKFGTIKAFAVHLGKSRQYITDICNGKQTPGKKLAIRMAAALDQQVSAAELAGFIDPKDRAA